MNSQERILKIYTRLNKGIQLSKKELCREFKKDERTIQRDFSLIEQFIEEESNYSSKLERKNNSYFISDKSVLKKEDILVIIKILLENRAFNKKENDKLIDNLLSLVTKDEKKEITDIIGSEKLNYVPITCEEDRIDKIWALSESIIKEEVINVTYKSPYREEQTYKIFPMALYYDSHYFYIEALSINRERHPTLKIDRIISFEKVNDIKPNISYGNKYRDGDNRNLKVDAFSGKKITVKVEFNYDPTIVQDQFPNARILSQNNDKTILDFETQYTPGLMRWIFSQSEGLKVLYPDFLVNEIREFFQKFVNKYEENDC
ncbi:transcriptional regulator [Floricoccus penangensis]|uniref:Transcriptional regulator n=1 Tax=Floricoccus penangensis TaxID=1859475 RepID=A0A9Q5JGY2_9LACT|nr:WYL domain-containing protein [Floricoccus penangensis]OFI46786.1 transcriptional regulator [Floricoccus penangensis]